VVSFTSRPLQPPPVPIEYEVGWAPKPVCTTWKKRKLTLTGLELRPLGRPVLTVAIPTALSWLLQDLNCLKLIMHSQILRGHLKFCSVQALRIHQVSRNKLRTCAQGARNKHMTILVLITRLPPPAVRSVSLCDMHCLKSG
jgi:hypothetical protein